MIYTVIISVKAEKDFSAIPAKEIVKIIDRIDLLSSDPYPSGSKKIKASSENLYRIRQGNYRVLYTVEDEVRIVEVRRIGHRKDIYRSK